MGTYRSRGRRRKSSSSALTFLLLIVLVFVGFYFLMIRPQRRRQQQVQQQQSGGQRPAPGYAPRPACTPRWSTVDGDDVILEVAPGVEVRYLKRAIMEVIAPPSDETEAYDG